MAIKRYKAEADNTITNSFRPGFKLRGTGSNTGQADVLEVFSIYGRETAVGVGRTSGSQELTRVLVQFPIIFCQFQARMEPAASTLLQITRELSRP